MMSLMNIAILMTFFFFGWLAYDYFFNRAKKISEGKFVRIFLYENVGGKPVYIGEKVAEEKKDTHLGAYLLIKKLKIPLKRISNSDFIQDKKFGKALHVVRFSSDDYRPLVRLNGNEWFKKIKVKAKEMVRVQNPDTGEVETNEVNKIDPSTGKQVYEYRYKRYEEPLGINQKDRDVLMFNLSYHKRMDEKYTIAESKLAKLMPFINVAVIGMILLIGFIYMTKSTNETQLEMTAVFDDNAKQIINEANEPSFIAGIADKIRKQNDEENAPPS